MARCSTECCRNRESLAWNSWIELDSTLIVRSLGSFPTAISSDSVLSNRAARYSALADLYQALGLVDKRSDGVDRMYQAMIALGHRPPMVEEIAAPFVETTRVGVVGCCRCWNWFRR